MIEKWLGEDVKSELSIDPIDSLTLDDFDFECILWSKRHKQIFDKKDLISLENGKYALCFNTSEFGAGRISLKLHCKIPDADFADGYRNQYFYNYDLLNIKEPYGN